MTGGRDESLQYDGGHSSQNHTVVLESTDTSHTAEHVAVDYLPVDRGHLPRTINHEGAMLSSDVGAPQSDSDEAAQMEPQPRSKWRERITDRTTANEPVTRRRK